MDTEAVIFGKWNNHGNNMNLRLSAQDSQKVDEEVELVFKHGNKHVRTVNDISTLKQVIKFTAEHNVKGFNTEKAHKAIQLYNTYHKINMRPKEALKGWKLDKKIEN
ncbi:hypothetical protein [Candidatus Nanohalovita haloferacivicina]|uniref:hypothetical protein n=1 Tax=Candidatus Nanohalovita haloferacivicina TaxID=2978046 RepID=UPI00325FA96D|nr:hypothetical protein HBNXNv_0484 [Candidatus Nanohalobia archaeon BNXNv]